MKFYISPYDDHISQIFVVNENFYKLPYIESVINSGTPFFLIDPYTDYVPADLDFFDAWNANFENPDGYGSHLSLDELLLQQKKNSKEYLDRLEQFHKPKNKDIYINMSKARNIWRNKLREDRKPLLEILDVQYIRALEKSDTNTMEKIAKKKQFLRDITEDPRIENAETDNDLRNIFIPLNFIEE